MVIGPSLAVSTGRVATGVVSTGEDATGVFDGPAVVTAVHLVQIVDVLVRRMVEVEMVVSMAVVPWVMWVKVTGQRVVDVSTMTVVWSTTTTVDGSGSGASVVIGMTVDVTDVWVRTVEEPAGQSLTSSPQLVMVETWVSVKTEVLKMVVAGRVTAGVVSLTGGVVVLPNGGVVDSTGEIEDVELSGVGVGRFSVSDAGVVASTGVVDSTGEIEEVELSGVGVGRFSVSEAGMEGVADGVSETSGVSEGVSEGVGDGVAEGVEDGATEDGVDVGRAEVDVLRTVVDETGCGLSQSKSM